MLTFYILGDEVSRSENFNENTCSGIFLYFVKNEKKFTKRVFLPWAIIKNPPRLYKRLHTAHEAIKLH